MNGFSDINYFYKNITTPCSKIIIDELYDTFDYFNFKLVDEVANNQNLQEQLLKKFNKITPIALYYVCLVVYLVKNKTYL